MTTQEVNETLKTLGFRQAKHYDAKVFTNASGEMLVIADNGKETYLFTVVDPLDENGTQYMNKPTPLTSEIEIRFALDGGPF